MNRRLLRAALVLCASIALAAGCGRGAEDAHKGGNEHGDEHAGAARGPHGGRVFEANDVRLELELSAEEDPPAFKAYLSSADGGAIRPTSETLRVVTERIGARRDTITFRIDGDHFHGVQPVEEPHSFTAVVTLERAGGRHEWSFEQSEGRIELAPEAIASARIVTGTAAPSAIEVAVEVPGEVRLNAERVVQVRPRFAGVVRAMPKRLGDLVRRDETLALIHSNESLSDYAITAGLAGTVVSQDAAVGQAVDHESILYTVADLSTVWVDFPIYPQSAGRVRTGQTVHVQSESGPSNTAQGTVRYVGPLLEQDTRVSYGRVVLDNRARAWQPGQYVTARVVVERVNVAVAVPEEAMVRLAGGPAVFRAHGNRFEPQPVVPGRSDGRTTEIVRGLEPGAAIVTSNAFLLKAELGKAEAHHEH